MKGIELVNAEIGTVSSRQDGSVAFRVITGELRPSEAGLVLQFHGKACKVTILPHEGAPEEVVTVDTERRVKSKGERLRNVHFCVWQRQGSKGDFEAWYSACFENIMDGLKEQLD
jgi:hypothetical protein